MAPEAGVDGPVQGEFIPAASGPGAEGPWRTELLVLAAAALLFAAFLVKITILPVIVTLGAFTAARLVRDRAHLAVHGAFYGAFLAGIALTCVAYIRQPAARSGSFARSSRTTPRTSRTGTW